MSDNHQEGPDPGSEELSDESYDEATVKLSHEDGDVAGEPAHDQTQHIPAFQEESTEDGEVYVILPDGEGGDIPVIETEVVDEAGGLLDKAPLSLEDLEDVPIRDSNPLFEATQIDEAADGFAQTEICSEARRPSARRAPSRKCSMKMMFLTLRRMTRRASVLTTVV